MAILLNSDSAHGRFKHFACQEGKNLVIIERTPHGSSETPRVLSKITISHEKEPSNIPWDVDVVIDCTGVFLTPETASLHLAPKNAASKAKKVVLSAPSKSPEIPMFVVGVNTDSYKGEQIVSNASCTTNCLAPMVKALHGKLPIKFGLMTTVHAVTASQPIVDGPNKRSRRIGFSGAQNIIPASTGAAKAVGAVIPALKGKLTGMAMRVPTVDVSVVDLTLVFEDSKKGLKEALEILRDSEKEKMKGVIKFDTSDSLTSAGAKSEPHSSLVDAHACLEMEADDGSKLVKLISWYDNEFGYSCRLMELARIVATQ